MSFLKQIGLVVVWTACAFTTMAQDKAPFEFGSVKAADFNIVSPLVDSNANAVIVLDKGDYSFEGNAQGWFSYVYKRNIRIKLLNKKGFALATVKLSLYRNDEDKETVDKFSATTYNYDNGAVTATKLDPKDILEQRIDKHFSEKKFTMPAIREGSIIEYTYTIKSDFIYRLPEWSFQQSDYPTLWSECNVVIPTMLSYVTFTQGYHTYHINKGSEGFKNYSIRQSTDVGFATGQDRMLSVSTPTIIHRWVMKDLPSLNTEMYVASPRNLISKINFQLSRTYNGRDFRDVSNTWYKVSQELLRREDFGVYLHQENDWVGKALTGVVDAKDDAFTTAKNIYYHVQNAYTCNDEYDKFINTTLQDVVKKKSGGVGDINLLLIAMLNHYNIDAHPVVLSTTEFGRHPETYPIMERLNYVIAKVYVDSKIYYLDATDGFLPFGKLPPKCYNGHAQVISPTDSNAVYFQPDSIRDTRMINVVVINSDKNEVVGGYTNSQGFYESLKTKHNIARRGLESYTKDFQARFPEEFSVSNIRVDSAKRIDDPVAIKCDFKLTAFGDADVVYFNPMLGNAINKNPFFAAQRIYPVEMPYTTDDIYILNMAIPKGYAVDELPKSAKINLNEEEGMFEYLLTQTADNIQMRCRLRLKKATFTSDDYQSLRDFYAFVVKKEAEQIVFKKIK